MLQKCFLKDSEKSCACFFFLNVIQFNLLYYPRWEIHLAFYTTNLQNLLKIIIYHKTDKKHYKPQSLYKYI